VSHGSSLAMSGAHHALLKAHLLPGDGREAAAILLCARVGAPVARLMVKDVHLVPHADCQREGAHLIWPGRHIEDCLTLAEADDLSLVLTHSHPGGFPEFSRTDNESDEELLESMFLARPRGREGDMVHGSAIMIPGGWMRARIYTESLHRRDLDQVSVAGDDIRHFRPDEPESKTPLAFSEAMTDYLRHLHAGVVGVSGTGSIVAEQVLRLGFGRITVIDDDVVEHRNLNRILNSTRADAEVAAMKVRVFERTATLVRLETDITAIESTLGAREAIEALAGADVLFCCVDTHGGRDLCDRLATALLLPLFDVGVVIPVRKTASGAVVIQDVQGRIDYIQPGASSLLTRGAYTAAGVAAEELRRKDPAAFNSQVDEGYMPGLTDEAPSVITVNMRAASMVVQEFIARTFPYRLDGNRPFARTMFALGIEETDYFSEDTFKPASSARYASGFMKPLLGIPSLEAAK
jgi:ThiF family/Prokaryotic homologs of the JAB domain